MSIIEAFPTKGATYNYHVDRTGKELACSTAKLNSNWTAVQGQRIPFVNRTGSTIAQPSSGAWTIPAKTTVLIILNLDLVAASGYSSIEPNGEWDVRVVGTTDPLIRVDPFDGSGSTKGWALSGGGSCFYTNDTDTDQTIEAICNTNGALTTGTAVYAVTSSITVQEIGRIIDPIEYIANGEDGLEETPVGNIISYMGNNVPSHYLACDGTEYNIGTYPELEVHFITEFGSVNYFGGNGTTTWAVPDLSGEFLRGTGTNGHTNQGNGGNVGEHQNATEVPTLGLNQSGIIFGNAVNKTTYFTGSNKDSSVKGRAGYSSGGTYTASASADSDYKYMVRPTNTSVKYCIKYESTYHVLIPSHTYKVSVAASIAAGSNTNVFAVLDSSDIIGDSSMVSGNYLVAPIDGWYSLGANWTCHGDWVQKCFIELNGLNKNVSTKIGWCDTLYLQKGDKIRLVKYDGDANEGRVNFCLITTDTTENFICASEVFSEDEQVIGHWIDGKPLYKKVIMTGAFTTTANQWKSIVNVSSLNIERLVDGTVLGTQNTSSLIDAILQVYNGNLQVYTIDYGMNGDGVVLKYTKTTDTAGTVEYKNNLLLMRPDLWDENTEIDFGGGLYGYRKTGTTNATYPANSIDLLLPSSVTTAYKLVNQGGSVVWNNSSWSAAIPYNNPNYPGIAFPWFSYGTNTLRLYLQYGSSSGASQRVDYDVWVTYKK